MPSYDYRCENCDMTFEVSHGIHENLEFCETCGGEVRRVFHPVGIVFKGSGFYATDSKKPNNKSSNLSSNTADKPEKQKTTPESDAGKKDKPGDVKKTEKVAS
ncbi:MAG: FmdB family transcriptional regulator [Candidatus Anoxymicrobium japonicum]|uniref:FmdB family transcriptional regulator n=1 Tax=Candidatus Anoxymicrobium japonicum TaxID=2013648 RepID=A0A2N3G6Q0_9ACTN|nr:MAG: FmdB family transcriptional regulator [Candidatus Anoxymicrobium japonicum]